MERINNGKAMNCGAFTLIEVLAAMVFLAILVPVLMEALTLSNRVSTLTDRRAVAAELAENQLNSELIGGYWQQETQTSGTFGPDYPGYTWQFTQTSWSGPGSTAGTAASSSDLMELMMEVDFPVQGKTQSVKISTLVSASVAAAQQTALSGSAVATPPPSAGTGTTGAAGGGGSAPKNNNNRARGGRGGGGGGTGGGGTGGGGTGGGASGGRGGGG